MKKIILSSFSQKDLFGGRFSYVRLYSKDGCYFVEYKYTSMVSLETHSFYTSMVSAKLFYMERVLFLLS